MSKQYRLKPVAPAVALIGLAIAALASIAPAMAEDEKKPNILIIWGDDIGQFNLSAMNLGVMGYQTPNIDRIAKEGRRLRGLSAC